MRKIGAFENVSLDGYFAGPNGEIDWFVAHSGSQAELDEFAIDSIKSTDTLLFGRVTYELMQATGQLLRRSGILPASRKE